MDVGAWLKSLRLEQYEAAFHENGVNLEILRHLTADDLKDLGVVAVGHRRQLLVAITKLQDDNTSSQAAEPSDDHPASTPAGHAVSSGGERRQLTVMFCDLVGLTPLSEKLDPEELRDLLHAYRTLCGDVITRYDGFVARYVGDGILTYFGWPAAHEDDAERAVRAALEIVETVRRASTTEALLVRIGIATGPVVVGEPAGVGDQAKLAVGSTPVREVAQIGAVIGRAFSYEMIEAVAPMPQAQLDEALARLCESGLAFRRGTPPDAVYSFKHALVQDAAYDSLLKRHRQELHAKIGRVIEQRFPHIQTTEPEMLAHHLTAAGLAKAAIPLWQRAGQLALQRMALTEAIAHLNQGLELVASLPPSSERDAGELDLRSLLGTAWIGLRSWPAPEVWTSLHPALALAKSLQRYDVLGPVLWGLTCNVVTQGRVVESLTWVQEMLDVAATTGDADLRIMGHLAAANCYRWAGEFTKVLEHADKVLDLYGAEKHRHLADVLYSDPKTLAYLFASIATWILGYPDRALRLNDEKDAHARWRGQPFCLGFALMRGAHEFDSRCNHADLRKRAEECERLGRENSLPLFWAVMAPMAYGLALLREGKPAEAIAPLKATIAAYEAMGNRINTPIGKSSLAEAMALTGDLDEALLLLNEAIAQAERPGWEERLCYAEILRLKGWVLLLKGDLEAAEQNFLTSLTWARCQQAKSWELRTSTSLARLWQGQGKRQDAYELLAPVYDWFTEGFDTKDLQEAKALLAELR